MPKKQKQKQKPPSKTRVKVVAGIIKSVCDEDQCSEAKSESEAKTFSWIKKANHCQQWLDLYNKPVKGWGRERSKMWTLKTKTDFTHISIEAKLMITKWQVGAGGGIGSWGLTYI